MKQPLIIAVAAWSVLGSCATEGSGRASERSTGAVEVVDVTRATFAQQVLDANEPVIVEFQASWCSHCEAMAAQLHELASEHAGDVALVAIDIDSESDLASRYQVLSVPTVYVFIGGEPLGPIVGLRGKAELAPLFLGLADPAARDLEEVVRALLPAEAGSSCDTRVASAQAGAESSSGATCSAL